MTVEGSDIDIAWRPSNEALLRDVEGWRAGFPRDARVDRLLEGVLFLRICEARGLEPAGTLQGTLGATGIHGALCGLFRRAGARYHSELFRLASEPSLRLEDAPLAAFLRALHQPAPYVFATLPSEILGRIHERLFGPSTARGAHGVFYTPPHLVAHAVRRLLAGRALGEGARILDPACGSGAFLVEALRQLLAQAQLPFAERSRLLTRSIFGVDLDGGAVEVAKLSLLLELLGREEGEPKLPDLAKNLRCGNALIDPSIRNEAGFLALPPETQARLAPFGWEPDLQGEGFDAIVGNPPYLNLKRGQLDRVEKAFFESRYRCARGQYDAFALFLERSLELLAPGGRLAFVLPKPLLVSESYEGLRRLVLERRLDFVTDCGRPFDEAAVEAVLVGVSRAEPEGQVELERLGEGSLQRLGSVRQASFARLPGLGLSYLLTDDNAPLIERMQRSTVPLRDCCALLARGIEAGKRSPDISERPGPEPTPLLRGEDVDRHSIVPAGLFYAATAANAKAWKDRGLYEPRPKILIRRVAGEIKAAIDPFGHWTLNTLYTLVPKPGIDPHGLVGILNSRALSYFFRVVFLSDDKLFPYLRISQLERLPIPDLSRDLALSKELGRLATERSLGPSATLDEAIEALVCGLYGVTPEERRLIEGAETAGQCGAPSGFGTSSRSRGTVSNSARLPRTPR